jgi:hypothetical protein
MVEYWGEGFYKYICETVREVIITNVIDYIYGVMKDEIYSTVYNAYTPQGEDPYNRRFDSNGGLADMSQFDYKLDMSKNGFTINVYDNARANGDNYGDYLDEIIVNGNMYTWQNSKIYEMQPFPRDFYQATLEELIDKGELFYIVQSKLKDRGINII